MKFLLDFFPIVLFFVVYKTTGLYAAIYAMIAATFVQMVAGRMMSGKFEKAHIITFILLVVFGGITLLVRDPAFVMWKVSVLYVVFAAIIIGSLWVGKMPILQRMLGKNISITDEAWRWLTWIWGVGFVGIAAVNAYFVKLALAARSVLFQGSDLDNTLDLADFDCASTNVFELCQIAQNAEATWVNFKLFGTMGLTFGLILITVILVSKFEK